MTIKVIYNDTTTYIYENIKNFEEKLMEFHFDCENSYIFNTYTCLAGFVLVEE